MEPIIIVMITMLALPNGDNGVRRRAIRHGRGLYRGCRHRGDGPVVAHVECSELVDGNLTLNFRQNGPRPVGKNDSEDGSKATS